MGWCSMILLRQTSCLKVNISSLIFVVHCRIIIENILELYDFVVSTGIFSDTHLLTMMYIGEMCFWAVKYEDCSAETMDRKDDRLQFRDIGTQILNKYVLACEGPLQGQGWNTENAKEILSILQ